MERIALTLNIEVSNVPAWVQLIPSGVIEPKGRPKMFVDAAARKEIIANFAKLKNDTVIDYEHQTLANTQAPAAGWIKEVEDRGDGREGGIWARVEWTDKAVEYLKNREYRYLSPVVMFKKLSGRVFEISCAALTNAPAIDGMVPVVNKKGDEDRPQEGQEELKALKAQLRTQEVDNLVTEALKAGKITPATKDAAVALAMKDPDVFREFIAKATPVISLGEIGGGEMAYRGQALDATQLSINKIFGVSEESFKKYAGR